MKKRQVEYLIIIETLYIPSDGRNGGLVWLAVVSLYCVFNLSYLVHYFNILYLFTVFITYLFGNWSLIKPIWFFDQIPEPIICKMFNGYMHKSSLSYIICFLAFLYLIICGSEIY